MHRPTPLYTATLPILNLMNRCLLHPVFLLAGFALGVFALSPPARAVNPPPDGGYAGNNTAEGTSALFSLTSGVNNTAIGFQALFSNTTSNYNTAEGFRALFRNTSGTQNTAIGVQALFNNTSGIFNTATGTNSLASNTTAPYNTAYGVNTLYHNTTGTLGTAVGNNALFNNSTGNFNTAVGANALFNITTGSSNIAIGRNAGTGLGAGVNNNIAIGVPGAGPFATLSNTCFIGSIYNQPVSDAGSAQNTYVDQYNVLGFLPSSRRFKHEIKPMDNASEAVLALKPVTFIYNSDKKGSLQYGLIAEEVAEVAPDLVFRDKNGDVQTVRSEQINMMLLNEFLKEHKKVEEQQASIAELKSTVAQQRKGMEVLTAQLKEQAAQIQKVSAQLEVNKPAPQVVANKP
jgi:trimeric autotransporter adhesin